MELYITHLSVASACQDELPKLLQKESSILIFYDSKDYALSKLLMDYISTGKIKIRQLPDIWDKSAVAIAYEIGTIHRNHPDTKIYLWGNGIFGEIFDSLIKYAPELKETFFYKENGFIKKSSREDKNKKVLQTEKIGKVKKPEKISVVDEKKSNLKTKNPQTKGEIKTKKPPERKVEKEVVTEEF